MPNFTIARFRGGAGGFLGPEAGATKTTFELPVLVVLLVVDLVAEPFVDFVTTPTEADIKRSAEATDTDRTPKAKGKQPDRGSSSYTLPRPLENAPASRKAASIARAKARHDKLNRGETSFYEPNTDVD